jgi:cell division transport system permease protein
LVWVLLSAACLYGLAWIGLSLLRAPQVLPDWVASSDAVVYLKASVTPAEEQKIGEELRAWPEIASIHLVTREETHRRLQKQLGSWKGILAGMGVDYLQPSVELTFQASLGDGELRERLLDRVRVLPNVAEILYGNGEGDKLESILSWAERGLWGLSCLLILLFTYAHWGETIGRISISRDELEALWWVGAPEWLIRLPFLVSSWATGTMGAIMALTLFALTAHFLEASLPLPLSALFAIDGGEWLLLATGLTAVAWLLGSLGVLLTVGHMRRLCSDGWCS